jgi:hypothetical protein
MPKQNESEPDVSPDEGLIQGGEISGLDQETEWRPEKHHAVTASRLANWLLGILVISFVVHYLAIVVLSLCEKEEAVEALSSAFGSWLPVMSGFVGGAVTYYFTREQGTQ